MIQDKYVIDIYFHCIAEKTDEKEMLSKIPRNVLKKMYKIKVTKETVPKATQKKPSTIKPVIKQHFKKKFIATINSSKQGKAKIHSKLGSVKKGMKASVINLSKSNTMTSKPVYAKVIRRHKLPTEFVTVKPPVSEMKTFRYIDKDDNSTVKYVKMMIQKIIAMMGKNLKLMYNNDTNVPISPYKQSARDLMMTRIDNSRQNSVNRSNKRELYKNLKYRSKRSDDMGDVNIKLRK